MLAIAGGKGGCGKTTTTLGLALAFARRRQPCLAVDADRDMPNLHAMAGVDRTPHLGDATRASPDELAKRVTTGADASVLPAPPTTVDCDLRALLERVRDTDPRVLVDCPAGAGRAAAAPLRVADRALLVTTLRPPSLEDAAKTAAMARQLDAHVVGAVLTQVDERETDESASTPADSRAPSVCERVERLLDCPVLATVPNRPRNERSGPAFADSVIASSYARLASSLV